jgi:hypothetical protein
VGLPVPIIFLDLDGVLNPFAAPTCPSGYQERVFFDGEPPERYCPAHGDWIRELAAVGEVWWATGWGQHANDLYLPLLGVVEPLPVVRFPPVPFVPELKIPAIDAVAGGRPAVWIDDNHTAAGQRGRPNAAHRRCWYRSIRRSAGPGATSTASSAGRATSGDSPVGSAMTCTVRGDIVVSARGGVRLL